MGGLPTSEAAAAVAAAAQPPLPAGQVEMNGQIYMPDAKGALLPLELVKPQHRLQDEAVRAIFAEAEQLAATIAAFKAKAFDDVDALQRLLEEQYKAKAGGEKGNLTLFSYDGLLRVQIQVADLIKLGPELQVAKSLVGQCIAEWSEGSRSEIRALVMNAFRVDKEGKVNRGALLSLQRLEISDERWVATMKAITDSIQVIGSKRYIRFSRRASPTAAWENVSLDIATA